MVIGAAPVDARPMSSAPTGCARTTYTDADFPQGKDGIGVFIKTANVDPDQESWQVTDKPGYTASTILVQESGTSAGPGKTYNTRSGVSTHGAYIFQIDVDECPAAPMPPTSTSLCSNVTTGFGAFTDLEGNAHKRDIECLAYAGITSGVAPNSYGPDQVVSRGQMASFIARTIDEAGRLQLVSLGHLPDSAPDAFTDDAGSPHEANINRLASAGIINGTGPGAFSPGNAVTRGQMASFINRAQAFLGGTAFSSNEDFFTDDTGSAHETNINGIASVGIAQGVTASTYAPDQSVTRGQMAAFLIRYLGLVNDVDAIKSLPDPGPPGWRGPTTLAQGPTGRVDPTARTTPGGLAALYFSPSPRATTAGDDVGYRRLANGAWTAYRSFANDSIGPFIDYPAFDATDSLARAVIAHDLTAGGAESLRFVDDDGSTRRSIELGSAANPALSHLGDGRAVVLARTGSTGTAFGAWLIGATAMSIPPPAPQPGGAPVPGSSVMAPTSDGKVLAAWFSASGQAGAAGTIGWSVFDGSSWSTTTTIPTGVQNAYLQLVGGPSSPTLGWADAKPTATPTTHVLAFSDGTFGPEDLVASLGTLAVSPNGTRALAEVGQPTMTSSVQGQPWTTSPAFPAPGLFCSAGLSPAAAFAGTSLHGFIGIEDDAVGISRCQLNEWSLG
jgi:hypothetical protein